MTDDQIINYLSRYLKRWRLTESERPADLKSFFPGPESTYMLLEIAFAHIKRSCLVLREGEGPRNMWGEPMGAFHFPGEEVVRVEICECGKISAEYRACLDCGAEVQRWHAHMHIFAGGNPEHHFHAVKPANFKPGP